LHYLFTKENSTCFQL